MTAPYPELTGFEPCRTVPADLFFPEPGDTGTARWAKWLCAACPLDTADACLRYALAHPELAGIWGGTSPTERNRMRRYAA